MSGRRSVPAGYGLKRPTGQVARPHPSFLGGWGLSNLPDKLPPYGVQVNRMCIKNLCFLYEKRRFLAGFHRKILCNNNILRRIGSSILCKMHYFAKKFAYCFFVCALCWIADAWGCAVSPTIGEPHGAHTCPRQGRSFALVKPLTGEKKGDSI